jgi:hypothetical protein
MRRLAFMRSCKRQRMTVSLPEDTLERMRDAAYWTPDSTMAGMITTALEDFLKSLELQNGHPFSPRLGALRPGRPRLNGKSATPVSDDIQSVSTRIPA